jgi:hypothetical protein
MTTKEEEAVQWILQASAPGHLDAVVDSLQRIAPFITEHNHNTVLKNIKEEQKRFQCLTAQQQKQEQGDLSNRHPLVGPLAAKLEQYQQQNFAGKTGVTARMTISCDDDDDDNDKNNNNNIKKKLVIQTYVEKLDVPNRISGYWKATWTVLVNNTPTTNNNNECGEISGRVQIHSYAYEEGNAQVKIDQQFDTKTITKLSTTQDDDEPTSLVQPIMKQITAWESNVLGLLAAMNETGGTGEHLKSIRRVLPITKTKMKWDVVAQRSVKTLKKTAPQATSKVNYGTS